MWDVMSALYTEVLSRNEWLQVMDHALINEPLWLWLFHVRWLVQLQPNLMALKDPVNLAAAFRRLCACHPLVDDRRTRRPMVISGAEQGHFA